MVSWSETASLDVRSSIADQSLLETGITAAVNGVLVRDCFTDWLYCWQYCVTDCVVHCAAQHSQ